MDRKEETLGEVFKGRDRVYIQVEFQNKVHRAKCKR